MKMEKKKKKSFSMPHVFIILVIIMFLIVVLSWIIPSGTFERTLDASGREIVNPNQFTYLEKDNPISFMDFFEAIFTGIVQGGDIIVCLLLSAGALKVLENTGTFSAAIHWLIGGAKGREELVVILFYTIFAIFGVVGFGEGAYPFYAMTTAVIMALGYDRVAGAAVIMMSSSAGFTCGMLNLYTTGVAQQLVGLPMFSGVVYRGISFLVFYVVGLAAVLLYCRRIKKNPMKSYVADEYMKQLSGEMKEKGIGEYVAVNKKHIIALLGFLALVVLQGYGCLKYNWGMGEVTAIYLIFIIPIALLFKIKPDKVCQDIVEGATEVLTACLAIGLARSVMVLMTQANILDTVVNFMGGLLQGKSAAFTLLLIMVFVTLLNFFVVSGSGKAVIMMPILSPLGKLLNINQQVMVLTYQFGDGFTNYLWPAGALVGCSLCKLEYGSWFKFAWKALGAQIISAYVLIVIADMIHLGPF